MNKKLWVTIIALICLTTCVILLYNLFIHQNKRITPEEAVQLCFDVMGEKDEKTGFPFSFGVTQSIEKDGKEYYVIRASWLVNNSHMSYIGDFFVTIDGKEVYTGYVAQDEYVIEKLIWEEKIS